jgi:hypothetical protein
MPEIGTSSSMSGDGKRSVGHRPQATAPVLDSTIASFRCCAVAASLEEQSGHPLRTSRRAVTCMQVICPTSEVRSILPVPRHLQRGFGQQIARAKNRNSRADSKFSRRSAIFAKIFLPFFKSSANHESSRTLERGATRSSRVLGAGCDGRCQRVRRARLTRTAKSCGPGAPGLALSLAVMIRKATVTMRSRTPGRARSSR